MRLNVRYYRLEGDGDLDERMYFVQSYVQEVALQKDQPRFHYIHVYSISSTILSFVYPSLITAFF